MKRTVPDKQAAELWEVQGGRAVTGGGPQGGAEPPPLGQFLHIEGLGWPRRGAEQVKACGRLTGQGPQRSLMDLD